MSQALYEIQQLTSGHFQLFERGILLVSFTRDNFRMSLSGLGRGNNWIGSILRLFLRKYPPPVVRSIPLTCLERYSDDRLIEYMQNRGYRVYKSIPISDEHIKYHLLQRGYIVESIFSEPILGYSSNEKIDCRVLQSVNVNDMCFGEGN